MRYPTLRPTASAVVATPPGMPPTRIPPMRIPPTRPASPVPRARRALAGALLCLALAPAAGAAAQDSLTGPPIDHGFGTSRVCCIDVAAVNLLLYLERVGRLTPPSGRTPAEYQEDFHKLWDPDFAKKAGGGSDYVDAMKKLLEGRKHSARIKVFERRDLTYEALVTEWQADELIVLFVNDVSNLTIGHALFLWKLETDLTKPRRIGVVDPNVDPNTGVTENGQPPTTVNGQPYTGGTSTTTDLAVGQDADRLPSWRFRLTQPKVTYEFADGTIVEKDPYQVDYRVAGFVSVSDVKSCTPSPPPDGSPRGESVSAADDPPACLVDVSFASVPEPAPASALGTGLVGLAALAWSRRRAARRG